MERESSWRCSWEAARKKGNFLPSPLFFSYHFRAQREAIFEKSTEKTPEIDREKSVLITIYWSPEIHSNQQLLFKSTDIHVQPH